MPGHSKIKLPYGIVNFKRLRTEGYYFVDKTRFIEVLESCGEPFIFFLYPRHFDKSWFIFMLSYYSIPGLGYKNNFVLSFREEQT